MGLFYAFRGMFSRAGSPPVNQGIQSGQPAAYAQRPAAPVTFDTAMQVSAVWAAVKLISEAVASLPFTVYRKGEGGRVVAADHPLTKVFSKSPNRYQTNIEFWESMTLNLALSGNAYAIIQRSGADIVGLLPVSSAQMQVELAANGDLIYVMTTGSDVKAYSAKNIWHVKLFGNGFVGLSPLDYARNSIGIASAADNRVTEIYSNGAKPSGVLSIDKMLTDEQRARLKENYSELGAGNSDRLFVLEAGMAYHQVSMTPQDIQLLDSRRFQIEDIGRFFGVPSILLNQTFGQSSLGSNVYEILSAFYKLNLRPYLEKFESSAQRWLIVDDKYEGEFDFNALLRGDLLSRMQAHREAINSGQMTPNEARAAEGRKALDGGDQLLIQGAMIPIQKAGDHLRGAENATQEP